MRNDEQRAGIVAGIVSAVVYGLIVGGGLLALCTVLVLLMKLFAWAVAL